MSFESSHSRGDTTVAIQNLLEQIERGENLLVAKQQVIAVAYGRLRILARKMLIETKKLVQADSHLFKSERESRTSFIFYTSCKTVSEWLRSIRKP